jgi:hypothetical protein
VSKWSWPQRFPLVQFPNLPLLAALASTLAARLTAGSTHRVFTALFYAALSVWSYEEARRGENWFRRLLGVGIGAYVLIGIANALHE